MWQLLTRAFTRLAFWRSKALVGIEFGASVVRMVVLERHRGQFHVKACDERVVDKAPDGMNAEAMQAALSWLLVRRSLENAKVAVVSSAPVMTKIIKLPKGLGDDEMEMYIRLDAEKYIPYPLDEVNFDFAVVGDDGDEWQVLLVVMRETAVFECAQVMSACGLEMNVLDVGQFALARSLSAMMQRLTGRVLVVHIDDVKTHAYGVHIQNSADFTGFDYHQEYLNDARKPYQELSEPTADVDDFQEIKTAEGSDDGVIGMDFDEFLAMHSQGKQRDLTANLPNADNHMTKDERSLDLADNVSMDDDVYEIRFDAPHEHGFDDFSQLNQSDNIHDDGMDYTDKITKILKMVESYESAVKGELSALVLSGLADDGLMQALSSQVSFSVLMANPFEGMSAARAVRLDPKMAVALGVAMRADIGGVA